MAKEWKIGDQVAKIPHYRGRGVTGPFEIVAVISRKIVLSDGSEWAVSGKTWGSSRDAWYTGHRLAPWSDRHATEADLHKRRTQRDLLIRKLERLDLSWSALDAISAVLAEVETGEPSG